MSATERQERLEDGSAPVDDTSLANGAEFTQRYAYNKAWRERHPDRRHRWKAGYRARTGSGVAPRLGETWTSDEDKAVLAHVIADRDLAEQLGRSVQAVAVRRNRLRKRLGREGSI